MVNTCRRRVHYVGMYGGLSFMAELRAKESDLLEYQKVVQEKIATVKYFKRTIFTKLKSQFGFRTRFLLNKDAKKFTRKYVESMVHVGDIFVVLNPAFNAEYNHKARRDFLSNLSLVKEKIGNKYVVLAIDDYRDLESLKGVRQYSLWEPYEIVEEEDPVSGRQLGVKVFFPPEQALDTVTTLLQHQVK